MPRRCRPFLRMVTHGDHPIRKGEADTLKDVRRSPLRIGDYSVYVKRGNYLKKRSPADAALRDGR
jgi:hypothetical protein